MPHSNFLANPTLPCHTPTLTSPYTPSHPLTTHKPQRTPTHPNTITPPHPASAPQISVAQLLANIIEAEMLNNLGRTLGAEDSFDDEAFEEE